MLRRPAFLPTCLKEPDDATTRSYWLRSCPALLPALAPPGGPRFDHREAPAAKPDSDKKTATEAKPDADKEKAAAAETDQQRRRRERREKEQGNERRRLRPRRRPRPNQRKRPKQPNRPRSPPRRPRSRSRRRRSSSSPSRANIRKAPPRPACSARCSPRWPASSSAWTRPPPTRTCGPSGCRSKTWSSAAARSTSCAAAIARLRKAGKPVYAELTTADSGQYLLAAACDQIFMPPSGMLIVPGVRAEVTFYKGLLDKLGLQFDALQMGKYKGAAEPLTRNEMSKPLRESLEADGRRHLRRHGGHDRRRPPLEGLPGQDARRPGPVHRRRRPRRPA